MAAQQTLTLLVEVRVLLSVVPWKGTGYLNDVSGYLIKECIGVWLSLVERYVRDVEVASSNLVTPTMIGRKADIWLVLWLFFL